MTLPMAIFTFVTLWWIALIMVSSLEGTLKKKALQACVLSAVFTAGIAMMIHFEVVQLKPHHLINQG